MRVGGRLGGFVGLVSALALLNYGSRIAGGKPPKDALYQYSAAVGGLIEYGLILGIVLLLSRADLRTILALRRPTSWAAAVAIAFGTLVAIYALTFALDPLLHADREQGLTPTHWEPAHAAAYAANFVVIAGIAPMVEELMFRGLGFSVLERFGRGAAVLLVGLAFGLAHGLVYALPLLVAFGVGLAYLRSRTRSVYPGMVLHATFNALALVIAVTHPR